MGTHEVLRSATSQSTEGSTNRDDGRPLIFILRPPKGKASFEANGGKRRLQRRKGVLSLVPVRSDDDRGDLKISPKLLALVKPSFVQSGQQNWDPDSANYQVLESSSTEA
ncbi:MAG: hypothetical protein Q9174_003612 [Haloplaca sp. 1 TL-2023]